MVVSWSPVALKTRTRNTTARAGARPFRLATNELREGSFVRLEMVKCTPGADASAFLPRLAVTMLMGFRRRGSRSRKMPGGMRRRDLDGLKLLSSVVFELINRSGGLEVR